MSTTTTHDADTVAINTIRGLCVDAIQKANSGHQSVQITMAEDFGVQDRGSFYDPVGALRDVVQNHLLQLIGLFASEPPTADDADGLRDKRVEVFRAIPPADPGHYVRGQYEGYLAVPGVSPGSQTETFAALRLEIDNWRWAGALQAGKLGPGQRRQAARQPSELARAMAAHARHARTPAAAHRQLKPSTALRQQLANGVTRAGRPRLLQRRGDDPDCDEGGITSWPTYTTCW